METCEVNLRQRKKKMNKQKLMGLLESGESETLEFKSSFNKAVIETIVAFSNTKGGRLILGCNDQKKIIGISIKKETVQNWINEIKQNTQPSILPEIEVINIDSKAVALILVKEFPVKPISFKDRFFIRKNNSNHKLSVNEIVELRYFSLNYSFDSFEVKTLFNELDENALNFFEKRIKDSGRYISSGDLKTDFKKLGFIKDDKLTRATELLYGTHHTSIHLGRFKDQTTIIDEALETDEYQSIHRNKLLAEAFYLTADIEKYGTGFKRLRKWLIDYPELTFSIIDFNGFIKIEFNVNHETIIGGVSGGVSGGVNGGVNRLLEYIKANPGKKSNEMLLELGVAKRTIERFLQQLREENKIEFKGSTKTGGYYLV